VKDPRERRRETRIKSERCERSKRERERGHFKKSYMTAQIPKNAEEELSAGGERERGFKR